MLCDLISPGHVNPFNGSSRSLHCAGGPNGYSESLPEQQLCGEVQTWWAGMCGVREVRGRSGDAKKLRSREELALRLGAANHEPGICGLVIERGQQH
jgi:hypothetical protein